MESIIPIEDLVILAEHYSKLRDPEKDFPVETFLGEICEVFGNAKKPCNSFKSYMDGEVHNAMIRLGFVHNSEEDYHSWGEKYGLDEKSYRVIRNVTLEKFVKKTMQKIRSGINIKENYELYMNLTK